jgi:cysteine desulfurase/selenocysteine lyase
MYNLQPITRILLKPDSSGNQPMIYLDNAATSFPKPEPVYQALDRFARTSLANPGRAGHKMAMAAERTLDDCRHALNQFFNGEGVERWIFTHNCTDGLNLAIKGLVKPGDHVITSDLEHNSISRPLRKLEKDGIISLTRLTSIEGYLEPEDVRSVIGPKTSLVVLTHASNVLGTVQPIEAIGRIVREAGSLFLVDAAQSAGLVPIDLKATPIDLLAFPGHKALYGPTGTGALYVGSRANPTAWREGGTGGDSASETQPQQLPYFLEGGTPNVLGIAGLAAGIAWVAERGVDVARKHEVALLQRVVDWARENEGWSIAGRWDPATHVGALSLIVPDGITPQELGGILDSSFDIAVRPGLHCSPYIHKALGTFPDGTLRISPGPFSTDAEIDTLLGALEAISAGVL